MLWIPDECGVASDADTLNLVGGAVHLGDDNIVETLNVLTELSPDRSEGLAVAAPWSVVLDEDILSLVPNDILPVATDNNLDWSIVHLWDRLRFKEWFEVAILELLNELTDSFKSQIVDLAFPLVLLHVIGSELDKANGGCGLRVNTNVVGELLLDTVGGG